MVGLLILGFTAAVDAMFLGGLEFTPRDEALMEKLPFVIQGRWFFLSADGLLGKLESKLEGFTNRNGGFTISRSCQVPGPTQAVCLAMVSTVSTAKTPGQVPRSFLGILAALDQWIKAKKWRVVATSRNGAETQMVAPITSIAFPMLFPGMDASQSAMVAYRMDPNCCFLGFCIKIRHPNKSRFIIIF